MTTDHLPSTLADQDRDWPLRLSLRLDAAASGALGVLPAAGGAVLDELLGIPTAVLVAVVAGWWSPTALGTGLLIAQAAAVALFAELQLTALRRVHPAAEPRR